MTVFANNNTIVKLVQRPSVVKVVYNDQTVKMIVKAGVGGVGPQGPIGPMGPQGPDGDPGVVVSPIPPADHTKIWVDSA